MNHKKRELGRCSKWEVGTTKLNRTSWKKYIYICNIQGDEEHGMHKTRTGQYEEKQEKSRGALFP